MSVVAPLASLARSSPWQRASPAGERPGPVVAAGLALAVGCGALVAFEHDPDVRRRRRIAPGAALAAFSALAFGAFFVGTNAASDAGGVAWTVAVNRSTSFAALALAVVIGRKGLTYRSADLRPAAVIGLLDAGANALFALALTGNDEHRRGHRLAVPGHDRDPRHAHPARAPARARRASAWSGCWSASASWSRGAAADCTGTGTPTVQPVDSSVRPHKPKDGQRCLLAGPS